MNQLNFADLLKAQQTEKDKEADSPAFSLIPPTPQDTQPTHSFKNDTPQFVSYTTSSDHHLLTSPPPVESGIMGPVVIAAPTLSRSNPLTTQRSHSRSPSLLSSSPRPQPYPLPFRTHSRQSSISAFSAVSGDNSTDWVYESDTQEAARPSTNVSGFINPSSLLPISAQTAPDQPLPNYDPETLIVPKIEEVEVEESWEDQEWKSPQSRAPVLPKNKPSVSRKGSLLDDEEGPVLVTAITANGKKSHARKRPVDHIPRPRNAFILFRKHVVDSKLIPASVEIRHQNISVTVAKMWTVATPEVKAQFQEQARKEKEQHLINYPDYKYQPVYRRVTAVKHKAKANPVEERKCQVVASLILEGKRGEELSEAAKESMSALTKGNPVAIPRNPATTKRTRQHHSVPDFSDTDEDEVKPIEGQAVFKTPLQVATQKPHQGNAGAGPGFYFPPQTSASSMPSSTHAASSVIYSSENPTPSTGMFNGTTQPGYSTTVYHDQQNQYAPGAQFQPPQVWDANTNTYHYENENTTVYNNKPSQSTHNMIPSHQACPDFGTSFSTGLQQPALGAPGLYVAQMYHGFEYAPQGAGIAGIQPSQHQQLDQGLVEYGYAADQALHQEMPSW